LSELLIFATGLDVLPPLGFEPARTITFGHPSNLDFKTAFPVANTCSNSLRLPVLQSYDLFVQNMLGAFEMVKMFNAE